MTEFSVPIIFSSPLYSNELDADVVYHITSMPGILPQSSLV